MNAPSRRSVAFDVGIALAFAAIAFAEAASHGDNAYRGTAPAVVGGLVAALGPLPLAARRVRPLTSAAAVAALVTVPHLVVSYDAIFIGGLVAVAIATEGAARYGRRRRNRLALLFPLAGLVVLSIMVPGFAGGIPVYAALVLGGWTVGVLVRAQSERRGALRGELEARRLAESALLEQAVTAERTRVARELHDVIAHCVSLMVLQAGAARLRLDTDPDGSAASIAAIEATGHEALVELQRLLGLLRADPIDDPSASLAQLDQLTDHVRSAGLAVSVQVEGDPSALPTGLDRSLYRIVQESLTNALKHGSDATADLRVAVRADHVELEVVNAASAPPRASLPGGNGQTGMRERVAAFEGSLVTGLDAGRYRVHAMLPLHASSPGSSPGSTSIAAAVAQ